MSPKQAGIVIGAALVGAGLHCARHLHSNPEPATGCPCKPPHAGT